jgi:hypothetical protein
MSKPIEIRETSWARKRGFDLPFGRGSDGHIDDTSPLFGVLKEFGFRTIGRINFNLFEVTDEPVLDANDPRIHSGGNGVPFFEIRDFLRDGDVLVMSGYFVEFFDPLLGNRGNGDNPFPLISSG